MQSSSSLHPHLHARGCCGGGGETPMATSFQNDYRGVPILFKGLVPSNSAGFAAALCAIGLSAIFFRLLVFARTQLQRNYWKRKGGKRPVLSVVAAELLRALMATVIAGLGYALMLIAMTYVVVRSIQQGICVLAG